MAVITYWRNVLRKITTTEMDASFDAVVEMIADAGLSDEMPEGQIYIGDNTNTASLEILDKTLVGLPNVDNTSDANKPISIAQMASNSTGVKTGGVLSIGTGGAGVATTFTIADGVGMIVDNTVIPATLIPVTWTGKTNIAVTNIGTQALTFVAIDSNGNVIQQATDFSGSQHRQYIVIGTVIHTNLTTVTAVNQGQHLAISPMSQLNDLFQSLAGFNVSGNLFSANGANLNLNKSEGEIFKQGANYAASANNPNIVPTPQLTVANFRYNNQTGNASGILSAIDPNNYDLSGVTTAVPTNKFTVQRIFLFSSNLLAIQRGQSLYNSLAEAKAAIQTESFIINSSIIPYGVLRAFLVVQQGTTALNSVTKAFFLEAPKFGGTSGVGGLSVSTLQNAYDNSSTPEILTDSTRGALSIKRGSASDTDTIIEGLNNAGTITSSIDGNGLIYSAQATASTPSFFDATKKLISMTGALLGTWFQTLTAKTTPVDTDTIIVNDSASGFEAKKTTLAQLITYIRSMLGFSGLTNNYIPYWNGTNLVNSDLYRATGAGQTGGVAIRSARLFQALNSETNNENALGVYKNVNSAGKYDAQIINSNSSALYMSANQAPAGNNSLHDYALRVTNYSSSRYLAWFDSVDKTASEATLTGVDSGTVFIRRYNAINNVATQYYGTGIYISSNPTSNGTYEKYGALKLVLQEVGNNKGAWEFNMQGVRLATLNQDGQFTLGSGLPNADSVLNTISTTRGSRPFPEFTYSGLSGVSSPTDGLFVSVTGSSGKNNLYRRNGTTSKYLPIGTDFQSFCTIDRSVLATTTMNQNIYGFKVLVPTNIIEVNTFKIYCGSFNAAEIVYVDIYTTASARVGGASVTLTATGEVTLTVSSPFYLEAGEYWFTMRATSTAQLGYRSSISNNVYNFITSSYGTGASPSTITTGTSAVVCPLITIN